MSRTAKLLIFSIAFTVFTIGAVVISGCQSQPENDITFNDELPMDRRIGEIKSLGGVRTESQGTHLLQLDNGDTILLKSLAINLDDDKYSDETVEVRGVLTYTKDSKPLMEVMNIDILEQYEAEEAAKAKWKVYDNDQYGFTIKYRDDFEVKESLDSVTFEILEETDSDVEAAVSQDIDAMSESEDMEVAEQMDIRHLVSVKVEDNEDGLLSYLDLESDSSEDLLAAGLTKSKIGSNNLEAYKSEAMDGAGLYFYVATNDYIYTISFEAGSDTDFRDAQNLFYEMLATFKIDSSASDDSLEENDEEDTENNETDESESVEMDEEVSSDEGDEDENSDNDSDSDEDETEVADGFNVFENETFEFSIQYPKNWYYSGGNSDESSVVRRYEFGDEPTDEKPGNVYLDVYSGEMPSGSDISLGDSTIIKNSSDNSVELYIETDSGKYRISGPASIESTLVQMAGTLE